MAASVEAGSYRNLPRCRVVRIDLGAVRSSKVHSGNKPSFDQRWFKFVVECCLYLNGFHVFPQIKGENNTQ